MDLNLLKLELQQAIMVLDEVPRGAVEPRYLDVVPSSDAGLGRVIAPRAIHASDVDVVFVSRVVCRRGTFIFRIALREDDSAELESTAISLSTLVDHVHVDAVAIRRQRLWRGRF